MTDHVIRVKLEQPSVRNLEAEGRRYGKWLATKSLGVVQLAHDVAARGTAKQDVEDVLEEFGGAPRADVEKTLRDMEAQGLSKRHSGIFDKAASKAYLAALRRFRRRRN